MTSVNLSNSGYPFVDRCVGEGAAPATRDDRGVDLRRGEEGVFVSCVSAKSRGPELAASLTRVVLGAFCEHVLPNVRGGRTRRTRRSRR